MTTYNISGMSCQSCVARISKALEENSNILKSEVKLDPSVANITWNNNAEDLSWLNKINPRYSFDIEKNEEETPQIPEIKLSTYKPLILIIGFIALTVTWAQYPFNDINVSLWMRQFMAGFFIVFSFFKFINLEGFANAFSMYDVIARRSKFYGYLFPFIELGFGILFLINLIPQGILIACLIFLLVSTVGVVESNLKKSKIKCACLGDVFNLPMSTVTIIENSVMIVMVIYMILK